MIIILGTISNQSIRPQPEFSAPPSQASGLALTYFYGLEKPSSGDLLGPLLVADCRTTSDELVALVDFAYSVYTFRNSEEAETFNGYEYLWLLASFG